MKKKISVASVLWRNRRVCGVNERRGKQGGSGRRGTLGMAQ